MCRHCACTSSAITTHTSASTLWRHNLVAFCEMGSLRRQTGEVCAWIQRRWIGLNCLCMSFPLLSVGLYVRAHSCLQRSELQFTFIFHSVSAAKMERRVCYACFSIMKFEIQQWIKEITDNSSSLQSLWTQNCNTQSSCFVHLHSGCQ